MSRQAGIRLPYVRGSGQLPTYGMHGNQLPVSNTEHSYANKQRSQSNFRLATPQSHVITRPTLSKFSPTAWRRPAPRGNDVELSGPSAVKRSRIENPPSESVRKGILEPPVNKDSAEKSPDKAVVPGEAFSHCQASDNSNDTSIALQAAGKIILSLQKRLSNCQRDENTSISPPGPSIPPMLEGSDNKEGNATASRLVAENAKLKECVDRLTEDLTKCKEEAAVTASGLDKKLQAERKKFNEDRLSYERTLDLLTDENKSLKASLEEMGRKTTPELISANAHSSKEELGPAPREYGRQIEELQEQLLVVKRENENLKRQQEAQRRKIDEVVAKEKQTAHKNTWLNEKLELVNNQLATERTRVADLTTERNQARDTIERMKIESVHRNKYKMVKNECDRLVKELETTKTKLNAASKGNDALVKQWREAKEDNERLTSILPQVIRVIKQLKADNDSLKSDAKNAFSFPVEDIKHCGEIILKTISGVLKTSEEKIRELQNAVTNGNSEIDSLKSKLQLEAEKEMKRASEKAQQLWKMAEESKTMECIKSKSGRLELELRCKIEELEKVEEEKKKTSEKLNTMEYENTSLEAELKKKIAEFESMQEKYNDATKRLDLSQKFIETSRKNTGYLLDAKAEQGEQYKATSVKILTEKECELAKVKDDADGVKKENESRRQKLADMAAQQEALQRQLAERMSEYENCTTDLAASRDEIRELKRNSDEVLSRCLLLDQEKCRQMDVEKELRFKLAELNKRLEAITSAKDRVSRMYEGALNVASDQKGKIEAIVSALDANLQNRTREILVRFMQEFEVALGNMHVAAMSEPKIVDGAI